MAERPLPACDASPDDLALLRRFEPVLRFTRGEEFFPVDIEWYLQQCSLWVSLPDGRTEMVLDEGEVTPRTLAQPRRVPPGTVYYLQFSGPLNLAELAAFQVRERLQHLTRRMRSASRWGGWRESAMARAWWTRCSR
jgi:hypothetical protein